MNPSFETLISGFIENKIGISENFLNDSLASQLKENLISLFKSGELQNAKTGNLNAAKEDKAIRGDMIFWLDKSHENVHENLFFELMDAFIKYLNMTCYTGITGYEFHYTRYEPGSFYKKHLDQFQNDSARMYSMVMYLNEHWKEEDGGELCLHHANKLQLIAPENGTCIFFKSDTLEHEVLLTNKPRLSITGWLKTN